jgi:hypothetical protein
MQRFILPHKLQRICTVTTNQDTVRQYLGDLIAVLNHVSQAVSTQSKDDGLMRLPHASHVIDNLNATLLRQRTALEAHIKGLGGATVGGGLKEVLTTVTGAIVGLYGKARGETASRMLRDDYTALSFVSICTTMLHTTALALNDPAVAELTRQHMIDYPPLIMAISELLPDAVIADLAADKAVIANHNAADQANVNLKDSWRHASSAAAVA